MENINKTIDAICEWIIRQLNPEVDAMNICTPEMVKALAVLVAARRQNVSNINFETKATGRADYIAYRESLEKNSKEVAKENINKSRANRGFT